jgi:hypothetical protein
MPGRPRPAAKPAGTRCRTHSGSPAAGSCPWGSAAARQAQPQSVVDALATPRDADPELRGGEGRTSVLAGGHPAEAREVNPHPADGKRTQAMAPRLCKGNEGRGVQRGDIRKAAADDQVYQRQDGGDRGGRGSSGCPEVVARPPVQSRSQAVRKELQDTLEGLLGHERGRGRVWGGVGRNLVGMQGREAGKGGGSRGRQGGAPPRPEPPEMLPRARWWWTLARVVWSDGAAELGPGAEPPRGNGAGASATRFPSRESRRRVTTRQVQP